METFQTMGTVLLALSGCSFLLLALFDKPLRSRLPRTQPHSGIAATVGLLRATLAKLKLADTAGRRIAETAATRHASAKGSPALKKVA
jgi:hypothetical protein